MLSMGHKHSVLLTPTGPQIGLEGLLYVFVYLSIFPVQQNHYTIRVWRQLHFGRRSYMHRRDVMRESIPSGTGTWSDIVCSQNYCSSSSIFWKQTNFNQTTVVHRQKHSHSESHNIVCCTTFIMYKLLKSRTVHIVALWWVCNCYVH